MCTFLVCTVKLNQRAHLVMSLYGFLKSSVSLINDAMPEICFRTAGGRTYFAIGLSGSCADLRFLVAEGIHCAQKSHNNPRRKM